MTNKLDKSIIPFLFEKNIGQYYEKVKFVLKNGTSTTFFTQDELVIVLAKPKEENIENKADRLNRIKEYETSVLRIKLENANQYPEIIGANELSCKINYIKGKNKDDWNMDVPAYEKIIYKDVYDGIDLVYYENNGKLEHDFIVSPKADINNIEIGFDGADKVELDNDKNILINVKEHDVMMLKPKVYQYIDDMEIEINSSFVVNNNNVTFSISDYNKNEVLIIDPVLIYGSYIGGSSSEEGRGIAVDANENAYITGYTNSSNFPVINAYQSTYQGNADVFLTTIDTKLSGVSSLIYSTYIGGSGYDEGRGVAVDNNENAYITGYTSSTNFPVINAYQSTYQGGSDVFLTKIDTKLSGVSSLIYSTYIGGSDNDYGAGVDVDSNENAYIAGYTFSINFPVINAYQSIRVGPYDLFLVKIDTKLSGINSLIYSTYIGGSSPNEGRGVAVDANENAYIVGDTLSTDFPVKNAYQSTLQGSNDVVLVKIDTKLSGVNSLMYSTYIGGSGSDLGYGIAVDTNQNAYITGRTDSTKFPVMNAYQSIYQGNSDAFIVKLNTLLSDLVLQKSSSKCTVKVGEKILYTIKITNNGPDTASNVIITDVIDDSFTINSLQASLGNIQNVGNTVTWTIPSLNIGQSETATIEVIATNQICSSCNIENIATATCDTNIINPNNATDKISISVDCSVKTFSDLQLRKTAPKRNFAVGEQIPFTVKVKNNGPEIATNIIMTDMVDTRFSIISLQTLSGTISQMGNLVVWTIPSLGVGVEVIATITVIAQVGVSNVSIANSVSLVSDSILTNPNNSRDATSVYIS